MSAIADPKRYIAEVSKHEDGGWEWLVLHIQPDQEEARLREAVGKAVERMAGPLGRARSRALDGVSGVEQMRDLDFIYDGVKELRAALSDPDTGERS